MKMVRITSVPFVTSQHRSNTWANAWEDSSGAVTSRVFGPLVVNDEGDGTRYVPPDIVTSRVARLATLNTWKNVEPCSSQSLVTVAEAHKSWDTIAKRASQLASIVSAVRKGDANTLNRIAGRASTRYPSRVVLWDSERDLPITSRRGNTVARYFHRRTVPRGTNPMNKPEKLWLEYRYGWMPLVYDIVDTLKAIHADDMRASGPNTVKTARGKADTTYNRSTALTSNVGGITSLGVRSETHEYSIRGYILYRDLLGGVFRRLNDFGLFDVPRAAWELVPLSFVVDWFVPVGDYLAAIQPKYGVEVILSGHTLDHKVAVSQTCTVYQSNSTNLNWQPLSPIGAADKATIERKERFPYLGSLAFVPPLTFQMNVKRLADAAALIKSMRS